MRMRISKSKITPGKWMVYLIDDDGERRPVAFADDLPEAHTHALMYLETHS